MSHQWIILLLLSAAFLLLFAVTEILYRRRQTGVEYTRKISHAGSGLLTLSFPLLLTQWWQAAVLCGAFLLLLVISKKYGLLKSIHAVERKTAGSWLFPAAIMTCFFFYLYAKDHFSYTGPLYYFYMPVLILALADPAAAIIGKWYQHKKGIIAAKTNAGSVGFFIVAFIIAYTLALIFKNNVSAVLLIVSSLSIAVSTTLSERGSRNGWDNFFIPAVAIAVQTIFEKLIF